jgi:GT2 family glycosyltransferase
VARVEYEPLDVIVLDNASADGTADAVRAAHPDVDLIVSPRNLGFAAGVNRVVGRAFERGADAAVLLNPDTAVDPGFAGALVRAWEASDSVAGVCAKILFLDRPDRIWYAGARLDPRRGHQGRHEGFGEPDGPGYAGVRTTGRACAGAMLVPRSAWERVGGFDERLFLYWEDTDWSLRAHRQGLRVYVAGDARVWHQVSSASGGEGAPNTLYYAARNGVGVLERHAPLGRAGTLRRRAELLGALTLQALRSQRRADGVRAVWAGWRDFRAGRTGPRTD